MHFRPESPNVSAAHTLISYPVCAFSLVGGGESGVAAELFTSPEAVTDGQRDEFGLGEWQDPSGLTVRNATYQEQQTVENNLQRLWC